MKPLLRAILVARHLVICTLTLGAVAVSSPALTFTSRPAFARSAVAPLSGTLSFNTDVPTRVSIAVHDGVSDWTRHFHDFDTNHVLPIYGFKADRTNLITVTIQGRLQNESTSSTTLTFITDPLPSDFPVIKALVSKPELMEPGYNLFRSVNLDELFGYEIIVDNAGEVVWYSSMLTGSDIRQLPNGNLFFAQTFEMYETDLLGNTIQQWRLPDSLPLDSHDGFVTDHNSVLYINDSSQVVTNFPTSATDPSAPHQTANVEYNRIVEASAKDGSVLHDWSLLDTLDPLRITYLTFSKTSYGWDTHHGNAIIEDPRDNSIIVSLRNQNAVIKFDRAGTLKWILGPHENWSARLQPYLLTPVGTPLEWNYGQHNPTITPNGTLLLYDDGNFRASPFESSVADAANYSRAVEFQIDEEKMEVKQIWEYGRNAPEQFYTGAVGGAEWLPKTGHVLVDFGLISYVNHVHPSSIAPNGNMSRIIEVSRDEIPEVVFDLELFDDKTSNPSYKGNYVYRCHRIPDLYGHPAVAVSDLSVTIHNGVVRIEFSGDPVRSYFVEESEDLESWQPFSKAELSEEGLCNFSQDPPAGDQARFYRVRVQ